MAKRILRQMRVGEKGLNRAKTVTNPAATCVQKIMQTLNRAQNYADPIKIMRTLSQSPKLHIYTKELRKRILLHWCIIHRYMNEAQWLSVWLNGSVAIDRVA